MILGKFDIYDYDDQPTTIDLKDKDVKRLEVEMVTGDEIVTVVYADGSTESFDSSNCRLTDYYDGEYTVEEDRITEWVESAKPVHSTIAYTRLDRFWIEQFRKTLD